MAPRALPLRRAPSPMGALREHLPEGLAGATVSSIDSRAIFPMDIGFHKGELCSGP